MNTPKPPPPVRRSSSISSHQNPVAAQKYRTSPPRQLNTQNQPPPVSAKPTNAQNNQSNHRRSLSASGGTNTEHAYAELTEIQQSIQLRHQQQQQQQGLYATAQGYPGGYGPGAMSAPATPQYAQPVTTQNPIVHSNVVNSLNTRFAAMNTQMVNSNQQSQCNSSTNSQTAPSGGGVAMPELPPPPSEDELREMEQIYNVPKQIQPTQAYNAQTSVSSNVQMRQSQAQPGKPVDMRQSLISEMIAGNKFRQKSNNEGGSEC